MSTTTEAKGSKPRKMVLCFDGTGNTFSGSNADTNVVKLLNKLDRQHPNQNHYYQPGVGTYDVNERSVNKFYFEGWMSSISQTVDQAIGTTFDSHVMAGYRFLMRYYEPGAKIYMFGFSRGAYTAKFLARMVNTVGLLCKGNEEMVPFAFKLYQRYLAGELKDYEKRGIQPGETKSDVEPASAPQANGETTPLVNKANDEESEIDWHSYLYTSARNELVAFSNTFCRMEPVPGKKGEEQNVKVYFLGLWDCVNSVAVLERQAPIPVPVVGNATYVRHAVAADERRVKFKPALIAQDTKAADQTDEDIKEVWFPGCHGDVGGGWPATATDNLKEAGKRSLWQRIKGFWTTSKPKEATADVRQDPFQMSDVALSWMIRELELVALADPDAAVHWGKNAKGYKAAYARPLSQTQALQGFIHDSLNFGTGTGVGTVLLWKFMEYLPTITRWELYGTKWQRQRWPLNAGGCRDIPRTAILHESLIYRLNNVRNYSPGNNHGGSTKPCLKCKGEVPDFKPIAQGKLIPDPRHQTYNFPDQMDGFEEPSKSRCAIM